MCEKNPKLTTHINNECMLESRANVEADILVIVVDIVDKCHSQMGV